jgi:hypothetical protein
LSDRGMQQRELCHFSGGFFALPGRLFRKCVSGPVSATCCE